MASGLVIHVSSGEDKHTEVLTDEHIRIGAKYRSVKLHTTYSFGLDDQEFVVAFETDHPADFRSTPMSSCLTIFTPSPIQR